MTISLRQLSAFVRAARLGSFKQAADALHVSQSALTMQIMALEDSLGVKLFDRSRRNVGVTVAGSTLLPLAEGILDQIGEFSSAAEDFKSLNRGVVRIAALPSVASHYVTKAARILREEYPGFRINIIDAVAGNVIDLVRKGDVDFGISSPNPAETDVSFDFLLFDNIYAYLNKDLYKLADHDSISFKNLASMPLILSGKNGIVRQMFDRAAASQGLSVVPAYEAVYDSTAIALAREGLGVAVLSELIQYSMNMSGLSACRICEPDLKRTVSFVQSNRRDLSKVAKTFQVILRTIASLPLSNDEGVDVESRNLE